MSKDGNQDQNQYEIVIVECCQNCQSHQSYSRHSEWKYFEQFNQLKRKIQRFVPNAIVIKNPVPDEIHKPNDVKLDKNVYIDKNTNQKIIYPRIGSFQVYIYNILISSKLKANSWPNHYKVLQTLNQIVTAKRQGQSLQDFSIYNNQLPEQLIQQAHKQSIQKRIKSPNNESLSKLSPQRRHRIVSKKKKSIIVNEKTANKFRVYKSKQQKVDSIDSTLNKKSLIDPLLTDNQKKKKFSTIMMQSQHGQTNLPINRYSQSKQQNRVVLPSLKNTIDLNALHSKYEPKEQVSLQQKNKGAVFNSIDEGLFQKDQMSIIQKDLQTIKMLDSDNGLYKDNLNRFDSLILNNNDESILDFQDNNISKILESPQNKKSPRRRGRSILSKNTKPKQGSQNNFSQFDDQDEEMKFLENRSVQYSLKSQKVLQKIKQMVNRSVQYSASSQQNNISKISQSPRKNKSLSRKESIVAKSAKGKQGQKRNFSQNDPFDDQDKQLKFFENRSVQYSTKRLKISEQIRQKIIKKIKQTLNRSTQCQIKTPGNIINKISQQLQYKIQSKRKENSVLSKSIKQKQESQLNLSRFDDDKQMKILQNRSVQYSLKSQKVNQKIIQKIKDTMNKSIQYSIKSQQDSTHKISESPRNKKSPKTKRKKSILGKNTKKKQGSQNYASQQDVKYTIQQNIKEKQIKLLEDKSVQYSLKSQKIIQKVKQTMNRQIQYQKNKDQFKDYGIQIEIATAQKPITYQFVQTDKIQLAAQPLVDQQKKKKELKPRMLDQSLQINIVLKKKQKNQEIQTVKTEIISNQTNTEIKSYANRGYQYPDQEDLNQRVMYKIQIDSNFKHLNQKRKNLLLDEDQNVYSIDKFQQKSTKYKWIGRADQKQSFKELKHKMLLESMVFGVYNFFGIKTPQKRLSYLQCSNMLEQKINSSTPALYHSLIQQNPEIQYFTQFQQLNIHQKMVPLSEQLTYKNSKQKIKFNNWGKFLALVYFLDDASVFDTNQSSKQNVDASLQQNIRKSSINSIKKQTKNEALNDVIQSSAKKLTSSIGIVVSNQQVKQIYRLNCQNYNVFTVSLSNKGSELQRKQELIFLNSSHKELFIDPKRLSKSVELQFFSMLSRLTLQSTFTQLKQCLYDIFINRSKVYDEKFGKLMDSIKKYSQIQQKNNLKKTNNKNTQNSNTNENISQKQSIFIKQLLESFISKLQLRLNLSKKVYKGQIYTYKKYHSLQARIAYVLPSQPVIEKSLLVDHGSQNQQKSYARLTQKDVVKMLRGSSNMIFLNGSQGSGKSQLMKNTLKQLTQSEKYNVIYFKNLDKVDDYKKFIEDRFYQKRKNIILIDNVDNQKQAKKLVRFIKTIVEGRQDKYDVSYFCIIGSRQLFEPLTFKLNSLINKNISKEQKFISLKINALTNQQIKFFISKSVDFKNLTQKEDLSDKITANIDKTSALKNILYLNIYCQIIEQSKLDEFIKEYHPSKVNRWFIMKKLFDKCQQNHKNQLKQMGIQLQEDKNVFFQLRQLVLKLHLLDQSPQSISQFKRSDNDKYMRKQQILLKVQQYKIELIQQFFNRFEQDQQRLIKNHLQFYPIDLQFLVRFKTEKNNLNGILNNKSLQSNKERQADNQNVSLLRNNQLFIHSQFYTFVLVQAFAYYTSKGFKNLDVTDITLNPLLLNLLKDKAKLQPSFSQHLLQLVYDTQIYPALSEQASNAMTLLCHLGYQFSNLIFDHCQIQNSDISLTTFYNCSFRNTNLINAKMYKTSFSCCSIDSTIMDNVNLLVKKYQIQFTPMCCSLSHDGRQIALGCGNYLIVVATDSGKQIKKVQAHLDVIRSVKYSKDGKNLITIADDKTLRSWDTQSFRSVVFKLPQKGGAISYSNQSQTIATVVNKNDLKVWNIKSMANEALFQGHTDQITTVGFSANGEYILTGSKDSTVRLWNLKGKQLHIYKGHQKQIICAKISPTNAIVASSSKNKQIMLFQTLTESVLIKKQFLNQITQICMDLKQKYIAVVFSHQIYISILDFNYLDVIHKLEGHKQKIFSISYDFSYQKLLSLSKDRTVRLWDLQDIMRKQQPLFEFNRTNKTAPGPILAIAYCKKSNQYSTGHQTGQINVWDDQSNTIVHRMYDHHGYVHKLQYDSTGKLYSGGKDGVLRIWNFDKFQQKKKEPYRKIELFSVQLVELKINQKNRLIVTSSFNSELVVYDFTGIKLILSTRDQGKVNCVAFDQKDRFMAIGGAEKFIVTYKIQNGGNSLQRSQQLGEHPDIISSLAYQGDSLLISVLKNGHIYIWNHMRAILMKKIQNLSPISCLSIFSKKYGCMASQDGKIRIINLDEGKQVKVFKYKYFSPHFITRSSANKQLTGNSVPLLYAGCKDGNILKWNLHSLTKKIMKNSMFDSSNSLSPMLIQQKKFSQFSRKAVNQEGTLMVQIQGQKSIKVKNLYDHSEQLIKIQKCPSIIEGVEFVDSILNKGDMDDVFPKSQYKKMVFLLKNGQLWSFSSQSIYSPSQNQTNGVLNQNSNLDGDLYYIKQKQQLFFKSGIKKISKQIKKPTQMVIDQVTIGG